MVSEHEPIGWYMDTIELGSDASAKSEQMRSKIKRVISELIARYAIGLCLHRDTEEEEEEVTEHMDWPFVSGAKADFVTNDHFSIKEEVQRDAEQTEQTEEVNIADKVMAETRLMRSATRTEYSFPAAGEELVRVDPGKGAVASRRLDLEEDEAVSNPRWFDAWSVEVEEGWITVEWKRGCERFDDILQYTDMQGYDICDQLKQVDRIPKATVGSYT